MNKHLRAALIVGGLAILVGVLAQVYRQKLSGEAPGVIPAATVTINDLSPDFEAKTINGTPLKLSQFKGKLVILNFWASWCGPCVEEVPSLIELMKEFPQDLELVAVSGDSSIEDIESFAKSFPEMKTAPNIHVVWDGEKKITDLYHIERLPESFMLGKDQHLMKRISGGINWHSQDAQAYIRSVLSSGNPPASGTAAGALEPGKENPESQDED